MKIMWFNLIGNMFSAVYNQDETQVVTATIRSAMLFVMMDVLE